MSMFRKFMGASASSEPAIIRDGNTVAWYDFTDLTTITKDGSNFVSRWNDKLLSGHDLIQATATKQPILNANGILFDGVDDFMKTAIFTLNQPTVIYAVLKQVTWGLYDDLWDGYNNVSMILAQNYGSPKILQYAGLNGNVNSNLALNTFSYIKALFNGANSKLKVNATAEITSNVGTANAGGFTLGSRSNISYNSNVEVKEIIIRKVADTTIDETAIYNYLKTKYNL